MAGARRRRGGSVPVRRPDLARCSRSRGRGVSASLLIEPVDPFARLADVAAVYAAALGRPATQWAEHSLPRHATHRDFDFLGAVESGRLVGIAYGYTGEHGQWWTEKVAGSLGRGERKEWLDAPHFEVAELHVHPDRQRAGIGGRLLDALLARQPHDRAVLSAVRDDPRARGFYAKHGWLELTTVRFSTESPVYAILGKRLTVAEPARAAGNSSG